MRDLDFSNILDVELLQKQCDAVAEANSNRPDLLRADLLAVLKKASAEGRQKARAALMADGGGLNCAYRISWLQDQVITVLYKFATAHIQRASAQQKSQSALAADSDLVYVRIVSPREKLRPQIGAVLA